MEGEIGDGDATEPCSDGEGIDDDDEPEGIESFFPLRDRPSIGGRERDEGNQGRGARARLVTKGQVRGSLLYGEVRGSWARRTGETGPSSA